MIALKWNNLCVILHGKYRKFLNEPQDSLRKDEI